MQTNSRQPRRARIIQAIVLLNLAGAAQASSSVPGGIAWQSWALTANSAQVELAGGSARLSNSGLLLPEGIVFVDGAYAAPPQPAIAAQRDWSSPSTVLSFDATVTTGHLVLGIGNLGHRAGEFAGYGLRARDANGELLPASAFQSLVSLDHRWQGQPQLEFNDDLALLDGRFVVSSVPGVSDSESDMLLLRLPDDVASIELFALGHNGPDAVAWMLGVSAVPEPTSWALWLLGGVAGWASRRRLCTLPR